MMQQVLTTRVSAATLVLLRDRTRQIGELFGLDKTQRTRLTTAVSEIARNTVQYATEGSASFQFDAAGRHGLQQIIVQVTDKGPGIANLPSVLAGTADRNGRVPLGIAGSRRLVDELRVECPAGGGTMVTIVRALPRGAPLLTAAAMAALVGQLGARRTQTPMEELEQQNRDMLFALDELRLRQLELQQADERKNQFLGTLAHELRNPLGTLKMTLSILTRKKEVTTAELAQRCEVMERQVSQLARLVDDLMDVSRVTHGKVALERQPLEVNLLVSQAVEMTGAATEARRHAVSVQLHTDALWIRGDAARLMQVLSNLIHNAARYTPEGGNITVGVRRESSNAVVDIIDDGIGIAADVLPTVFGLFVQAEAASAGHAGGLGVGLTLVQRLTEDHGGTVTASSAGLGQGSRFTVTLPLASAPAARHAIEVREGLQAPQPALAPNLQAVDGRPGLGVA